MKLNKEKLKQSFKSTYFKKGSFSVGLCVIVIAIVVLINFIMNQLPSTITSIDLSNEQYFSISQETKNVLKNLDQKVTIYQIVSDDEEDTITDKLLQKYAEKSDYIKINKVDLELNPAFLQQYNITDLENNSLIIESSLRYTVVHFSDMYEYSYDESYYYTDTYSSASYDGEGEISSAIDYVVTKDIPKVYTLYGHGEQELSTTISDAIQKQNFELSTLNLMETENIPGDCDILSIIAPSYDLNVDEANKVINYLKSGGKALIISDYMEVEMPNFDSIIQAYGLYFEKGYVVEGNSNNYYDNKLHLLPEQISHEITEDIIDEQLYILFPYARGIAINDDARSTIDYRDLLQSTGSSYSISDYGVSGTITKKDNDKNGPFSVAKTVSEEIKGETTKIVIFSSYYPFTDEIATQYTPANITLFTNSLNWLYGYESAINIASKNLSVESNIISSAGIYTWTAIFIGLLPIVIVLFGLTVWIRRKKA